MIPKQNFDLLIEDLWAFCVKNNFPLSVEVFSNEVDEIINKKTHFELNTQNGILNCKKVIICTGFYDIPYMLNIPGEDREKVLHYYNESHPYLRM